MKRNLTIYLSDIIENIAQAENFVDSMTFEQFIADRKTVYAVIRCFEIIGEATKNIPADIRAFNSVIPWSDMARMRDKCIHAYWGIKYQIIWKAIKEELPVLVPQIKALLADLRGEQEKKA
jgi:uncharacterized protein with HEPN domain